MRNCDKASIKISFDVELENCNSEVYKILNIFKARTYKYFILTRWEISDETSTLWNLESLRVLSALELSMAPEVLQLSKPIRMVELSWNSHDKRDYCRKVWILAKMKKIGKDSNLYKIHD